MDVYEGDEVILTLTNLGFPGRPDLDDTHTIHWHGFPNQIPVWDGVPEASFSVPVGRSYRYFYKPLAPGTYMYHCHFEPVEHIQMGMVGPLIVRPLLQKNDPGGKKYAYNNPDTEYDREALIFLTELDAVPHAQVAAIQEFDWSDYSPQYWLISGRSYPDTVKPGSFLPSQPYSSRIETFPGEKVLLRFVNLGFQEHSIQLLGRPLKIIGLDAQEVRGVHGEDLAFWRDTLMIASGQTADTIFTAPVTGKYILYNRGHHKNTNGGNSFGGMITAITVSQP